MPPWASGPVFTVSRPSRNGSACAIAGVGKRLSAAAAPAAVPANMVRRLTLRDLILPGITCPPSIELTAAAKQANRQSLSRYGSRQALAIAASAAEAAIIGEAARAVKSAIVAFFSTLLQWRIIARIDWMGEEFLFRPGPELADVFVGFDELIP